CSEFVGGTSQSWGCSNGCVGASCNFRFDFACPAGTSPTHCDANCISGCCTGGNRGGCDWGTSWADSTGTCDIHIGTAGCNGTTMNVTVFCKGP
ncbi:MAG: hypothetical protein JWM74_2408, partial [Myxococcaceae bacterium]|nr:hypothetical protein [Myxococcaceae bacterium]